jgi:hypothetical protein
VAVHLWLKKLVRAMASSPSDLSAFLEIQKLVAEKQSLKANVYLSWLKSALLLVGSIIVFVLIQRPESIINQKSSLETINRERAKLLLELFKETNPQKIYFGLQIIKSTYPQQDSKWLDDIIKNYRDQSNSKTVADLNVKLTQLIKDRDSAVVRLTREIIGVGLSHKYGSGSVAQVLRDQVYSIDHDIFQTQQQIKLLDSAKNAERLPPQ